MSLRERSPSAKATCCVVPTLEHSGKGTMLETVTDQWLLGGRGDGSEQVVHGGFGGSEATLCDTVTVHMCHETFVRTHRTCHSRSDPDVCRGLQVMVTSLRVHPL